MRCFVVPNDAGLRRELSSAGVVIYTVRLRNGQEVDVCDIEYKKRPELQQLLSRCEETDLDVAMPEF